METLLAEWKQNINWSAAVKEHRLLVAQGANGYEASLLHPRRYIGVFSSLNEAQLACLREIGQIEEVEASVMTRAG